MLKRIIKILPFFLILIYTIPLLLPLFHRGMFISDDAGWMIIRTSDFFRSLVDGQIPVRWGARLNHQYGYPVFNFLYPGILYAGSFIHLLGFSFVNSIKILFLVSIILSGIFSYLWLKTLFSKLESLIGSFIYLYFPYHLFDIYQRGSLGEALAIGIFPLILYSLEKRKLFLGSISVAFLILFHNSLAFIFLGLTVLYIFLFKKNTQKQIIIPIFGLLLSCFFWLPALFDRKYTIFDTIAVSNWKNFFINNNNYSLLGWGSAIIFILSLFTTIYKKNIKAVFFIIIFTISVFLSLPISNLLWKISPLPQFIQFPWRFLSLSIISSSFLGAFLINKLPKKIKIPAVVIIIFLFSLSVIPLIKSIEYELKEEGFYTTNEDTTTVKKEYMPKWVKNPPLIRPAQKVELINGVGDLKVNLIKSNKIEITSILKTYGKIKINTVYFPGWYAKIDGINVQISFNNPEGVIIIPVSEGKHQIEVYWKETPIRLISDLISFTALLFLLAISLLSTKTKYKKVKIKNQIKDEKY